MSGAPISVLLTGASGYIGGTLLVYFLSSEFNLEAHNVKLYALVRRKEQSDQVLGLAGAGSTNGKRRVTPLVGDVNDTEELQKLIVENQISVVIETVDAVRFEPAKACIEALAEVKKNLTLGTAGGGEGSNVHFIHTSGAKLFSSHAGVDQSKGFLSDAGGFGDGEEGSQAEGVYEVISKVEPKHPFMKKVVPLNNQIIDYADSLGVRSYIVVPPMVYGPGKGFGNKISIQIVGLVRVAKALGKLWRIDERDTEWALMHIDDQITLYATLLSSILRSSGHSPSQSPPPNSYSDPPHGRKGFYFSENGTFRWRALSAGILNGVAKGRGGGDVDVAKTEDGLKEASEEDLVEMGKVLGCDKSVVPISIAGNCLIKSTNTRALGWKPKYGVEHLMSVVDEEVAFMLKEDVSGGGGTAPFGSE